MLATSVRLALATAASREAHLSPAQGQVNLTLQKTSCTMKDDVMSV